MDEFEKQYFEDLRKLTLGFEAKRRELAKSRIKMFTACVARQILDEKANFDLILGGGNSGLFMTELTRMVYEYLNLNTPKIVNIPLKRLLRGGKKAKVLRGELSELKGLGNYRNILFVDDEIMRALTAKTCFELLLKANPEIIHIDTTIIAENHFFEWHYRMPKISVRFFAYSRLIQWLNSNISYFIPKDLFEKITQKLPEVESYTHAMAIVITGGLKKVKEGKPYFDFNIESDLKSLEDYEKTKKELLEELKKLVSEAVEEYRVGKIKFRF